MVMLKVLAVLQMMAVNRDLKKLRKHLYQIRKSNLGNNFNWWETAAFLFAWELDLDDGWLDESEEGHQADQMTT